MTMPVSILILLIVGLTVGLYFTLVPLQILSRREFIVSHSFIIVGIFLILGWIWLNKDQFREATMIMGGIWTLFGGLCFVAVYALRRLKGK
jgi:hypothetical protein